MNPRDLRLECLRMANQSGRFDPARTVRVADMWANFILDGIEKGAESNQASVQKDTTEKPADNRFLHLLASLAQVDAERASITAELQRLAPKVQHD